MFLSKYEVKENDKSNRVTLEDKSQKISEVVTAELLRGNSGIIKTSFVID